MKNRKAEARPATKRFRAISCEVDGKDARVLIDVKAQGSIEMMEIEYPSWDNVSMIHGQIWIPKSKPKGIVQVIHGMSEHISRYDDFARFLATNGFAVCGHDHIGHGQSVSSPEDLGHMPIDTGADILVEDADTLRGIAEEAFGVDLPYFMFGHSMGSFTLRVYLTRHGEGLSGAIICGTGNEPQILAMAGNFLARLGARLRGETSKSDFIHSMADGAFTRQVEDPLTEFDWLSFDRGNIDAFMADELNGFQFTLGGYASLTKLAYLASRPDLAKLIPPELPLLYISGAEDPVGNMGDGVRDAVDLVLRAGSKDVELILYEGMRHEILNEADSQIVFADVLAWLDDVLECK